ncbi:hypothetical protein AEQ67_26450 [Pseudomonas sp. RIT-PI-q]|uniref:hypothetical protein n=1 Tax=Pseudomonas sp. RIT-PI-q TaxID=1690247 RepID=UPI0006CC8B09|nr:hypothetical protein [Pseudomonas sp. RIT-PI-q]KPG92899.1 hypothetical protein AEQ67_26450 [Pseudomonas sp. RIT-PI-q]
MTTLENQIANTQRLVITQEGDFPVFIGEGVENLCCPCGNLLIEGYEARLYIELNLQCHSCKTITQTQEWPKGETLPYSLIIIQGPYYPATEPTKILANKTSIISEYVAERIQSKTTIRPYGNADLQLTIPGLDNFASKINDLCQGGFEKHIASAERALKSKNDKFLESPLAWAITHLKQEISEGGIDLGKAENNAAISYIKLLPVQITRWEHHALFDQMCRGWILEFHHTVTQLIAAGYLADLGNNIGFTNPSISREQSPDLYINMSPSDKVSIEVKAPSELQWPSEPPGMGRLQNIIEKQVKKAKSQITGNLGGIVVIGISTTAPGGYDAITTAIDSLIKRGKISSRIAAVMGVVINLRAEYVFHHDGMRTTHPTSISLQRNPKFSGPELFEGFGSVDGR